MMSRKRVVLVHLFIWLFAIFANLPYSGIRKGMPPEQVVSYTIGFLYLMFVFYLFYLFLAPLFLNKRRLAGFFSISFLVVLVMPFFGYLLILLSRAYFVGSFHDFFRGYSVKMHMSGYFPVLTSAVFGSFFRVIISWFDTMKQKAEAERQKLSAELDLLKSKLNPHFLFNTLNNIDSLIGTDPEKASASLIRLSDMMRYLTYDTSAELIEVDREVEYMRNFIELHRMRIKYPDEISFDVSGDMNAQVSPALFVPLLENAFKFVSYGKRKPSIRISLKSAEGIVTFQISNYYEDRGGDGGNHPSGLGLVNLKRRLEMIYPGKYRFQTDHADNVFNVTLTIVTYGDQLHSNR